MSENAELTAEGQGALVHAISERGLGEILKPLTKEIFLLDTWVAGAGRLEDQSVFDEVRAGDQLILKRERSRFDEKAILVLTKDRKKLGYVPERDNTVFSRLMDAGKMLTARITQTRKKESFTRVDIRIFLVDF